MLIVETVPYKPLLADDPYFSSSVWNAKSPAFTCHQKDRISLMQELPVQQNHRLPPEKPAVKSKTQLYQLPQLAGLGFQQPDQEF